MPLFFAIAGRGRLWSRQLDIDVMYLWRFTAAVRASAVLYVVGALPSAPIGSSAWSVQKVPVVVLSLLAMLPLVAAVAVMSAAHCLRNDAFTAADSHRQSGSRF
jgi:hypothetical protein